MKRLFAIILTLAMTVSAVSVNVFARNADHIELKSNSSLEHTVKLAATEDTTGEIIIKVLNDIPVNASIYKDDTLAVDREFIEANGVYRYYFNISKDGRADFFIRIVDNAQIGNELNCSIDVEMYRTDKDTGFFTDIRGHWAEEQIERIAGKGIIGGYPDGTFKPDAPVTRSEFAKIAALAFNLEPSNTRQYYADLNGNEWFYTYVQAVGYMPNYLLPNKEHSNMKPYIYDGYNSNFMPNENAVRMHIAEALSYIYVDIAPVSYSNDIHKLEQEVLATFNDDCYKNLSLGDENANKMIKFTWIANNLGIMQGDDNGNFNPYGYVTRAELVTMIDRMQNAKIIQG